LFHRLSVVHNRDDFNTMSNTEVLGLPDPDPTRKGMDIKTYLLTKLVEEALEIAKAGSKAITFGLGERLDPQYAHRFGLSQITPTNQDRMRSEIMDLLTIIDLLGAQGVELDICHGHSHETKARSVKVARYALYSEHCGTLWPGEASKL